MWKLLLGFIVFAAVALFVLKKAGGDVDMGGEKHDVSGGQAPAAASAPSAVAPAVPASAAASAASS
jgi:hypothetical protein